MHLYAEKDSPKVEPAARRWLARYLDEQSPTLAEFARVAHDLVCDSTSPNTRSGGPRNIGV